MSGTLAVSARSDTGAVRTVNEDSLIARAPVFLVADGMGGHARGEKASQEAVRIFAERIPAGAAPTRDDVLDAVAASNRAVRALSACDDSGVAVAGTTLTGVVLLHDGEADVQHWMIVNVGDSRVYDWDGRTLTQLTVDHSAVQELLDAGAISEEEAATHPDRNVITRALGAADSVDVDIWLVPAAGTQTFLICSDGLCKELTDEQIAEILAGGGSVRGSDDDSNRSLADLLVDEAVAAGGRDNVTVIVVESRLGDNGSNARASAASAPGYTVLLDGTHRG
ncbi:PP2C family protein-serine/threonine phosphatase [Rathayibacter soli]|uniref:PP2C family protein-serine/threonine phosphatase n=1 Tax=Rathayibacter soli TaxID=3144168 RepID=UPI0027E47968|nr:protein phosphatase 2C domain-containing protein [Glaciibacter superstes]